MIELELQPRQALAVGADEAEHLRRDRALWVVAALFGIEAEAGKFETLQRGSLRRVRLPGDVDEAVRPVREDREDPVGVHSQRPLDGERGAARIRDLPRVRVDGGRLLAERELEAAAVEESPAPRGDRDRFPLLRLAEARQRLCPHRLQPGGTQEQSYECKAECRQEKPDPPVD